MEVKCLEIRDSMTFIPVICIRPVPVNEAQYYLLRRDGYRGTVEEHCVIMIDAQCRGVAYDCYDWHDGARTKKEAHNYIAEHWHELGDGDVIDVEFILAENPTKKISERHEEREREWRENDSHVLRDHKNFLRAGGCLAFSGGGGRFPEKGH